MRLLHLFATIALLLCATAYDAPGPRRRGVGMAVPGNEVDALGVPNRNLTVFSISNTSDVHSLNMNHKRALEDLHLVRRSSMHKIPLTLLQDRFTGTVSFGDHGSASKVIFDTKLSTPWVQSSASSLSANDARRRRLKRPYYRPMGSSLEGVVTVGDVSSFNMRYDMVREQTGYGGGLALDRSDKSWLKFTGGDPVFAFYSKGPGTEEFHFGGLDSALSKDLEWHEVRPDDNEWRLKGKARILVNGKVEVENLITVIDTGVRYIYGPVSQVRKVYKPLGGSFSKKSGLWEVPCNGPKPLVALSWDKEYLFIDDFVEIHGTDCFGRIQSDNTLSGNNWLVGVLFLPGKYAAFKKGEVGFVSLNKLPKE